MYLKVFDNDGDEKVFHDERRENEPRDDEHGREELPGGCRLRIDRPEQHRRPAIGFGG